MDDKEFVLSGMIAATQTEQMLREDAEQARKQLKKAEKRYFAHRRFVWWHTALRNGETAAGMLGMNATYAWFVRRYSLGPSTEKLVHGMLREIDMLLVPDLLIPHELVVGRPCEKTGKTAMSARTVEVTDIVNRIKGSKKGKAANVRVSTFDEALKEACPACNAPALMVAMDEYLDDDNGHRFTLARLCTSCRSVEEVAAHHRYRTESDQYALTDAMYRT